MCHDSSSILSELFKNELHHHSNAETTAAVAAVAATNSGEVVKIGNDFRATVNGVQRYLGTDYIAAINAAIAGLTSGRTTENG